MENISLCLIFQYLILYYIIKEDNTKHYKQLQNC
jgi:hypothetical protein